MIFRLLIVALLLSVPGCAGARNATPQGVERVAVEADGREREYFLHVPKSLRGRSARNPVVLFMHGGGGTAQFAIREVRKTLFRLAERDGFYVVLPQAINKIWDFGAGRISSSLKERINDRAYFARVLDDVSARLPVDPRLVFVTGISRGGQASYFIACNFPERIRAIAAVAMPLPAYLRKTCRDGPPVGVAVINGTADPWVPYDGGTITIGRRKRDDVLSTDETIRLWRRRNGCTPSPSGRTTIDPARDQTRVEKTEWLNCRGAPVILYRIVGGGHTWPSGRQFLPRFIIGRVTRDIDGAEAVWDFFRGFR